MSVEIEFPADENGFVLQNMFERGVNLNREYDVDFVHLLPSEELAVAMAQEVDKTFSDVKISIDQTDSGFDVYVVKMIKPTHALISKYELLYGEIANKYKGKSDGWGFQSEYNKQINQDK